MNRFMVMAVAGLLLATGCGKRQDANQKVEIDWPARAATVKVGMTRAEVEMILPILEPPYTPPLGTNGPIRMGHHLRLGGAGPGYYCSDFYWVSENWQVTVSYSGSSKEDCRLSAPVKIKKVEEPAPPKPTP